MEENLYTAGGEFRKLNGEEYIGPYHVHPEQGPMIGPYHLPTPHERLIPISTRQPFRQAMSSTPPSPPSGGSSGGSSGGY